LGVTEAFSTIVPASAKVVALNKLPTLCRTAVDLMGRPHGPAAVVCVHAKNMKEP